MNDKLLLKRKLYRLLVILKMTIATIETLIHIFSGDTAPSCINIYTYQYVM